MGLLWFYWISFSFVYYDLAFLIPLVILGVASCYGLLFWVIGRLSSFAYFQALLLTGISFISPFGFNWFKLELLFLDSYMTPTWWALALFLLAITTLKTAPKWFKSIALIPLLGSLSYATPHSVAPHINVALPQMHIPQSKRWDAKYQQEAIDLNFELIHQAIAQGKDLIVLPESAFPLYLNRAPRLIKQLKEDSKHISIVTGALTYEEDKGFFNSSYFFQDAHMQIAHKIILVPFGEEVPFPAFIVKIINKIFFDGAKDYQKAKVPQDFEIKGMAFRSAICFEATEDTLFEGHPKQMIAISNNAWFSPSIEQTLQHLLLRYYAKKYQTVIYHSANSGISGIILP